MSKYNIIFEAGEETLSVVGPKVASMALKSGGKKLGKAMGCAPLRRFAGSNVGAVVIDGVVEVGCGAVQLARGRISGSQFGSRVCGTAGGCAGGYGGAAAGAAIGTAIFPGVGTAIGAMVGGMLGGSAGKSVGSGLGEIVFGK